MMAVLFRVLFTLLLVSCSTACLADEGDDLVDYCDQELFAFHGDINEAVARADLLIEWGRRHESLEYECQGLIRLAFAELRWGRWRNDWAKKRRRAINIAAELPSDSIARAELLMFNGFLKAIYFKDYEGGVKDLRHAIAVGEANVDIDLLAQSHFFLSEALRLNYSRLDLLECALRSVKLAKAAEGLELEHWALRALILYKYDSRIDASMHFARYYQLCEELGCPNDLGYVADGSVKDMLETVEASRYSMLKGVDPTADEIVDDSRVATDLVRSRRQLIEATLHLVNHYGLEKGEWESADPYINLLERTASRIRDSLSMGKARHFRALSLASHGEVEAAWSTVEGLISHLIESEHRDRLVWVYSSLANRFAAAGEIEESYRLLQLAEEQREIQDAKIPELAEASAESYCDLLRTKIQARQEAEAHRLATLQARATYLVLAIGLPILASCVWVWQRAVQNRHLQQELRRQLELKTKSLRLATERAEEANRAKSDYLARINHELRSPLGAIISSCEFLRMQADETGTARENSARTTIAAASTALVDIVDDVLDFTRIEAGQLEFRATSFSPRELLDAIEAIVRSQLRPCVSLHCEAAGDLPARVRADLPKLRQTILNLCNNAAKHTKQGAVSVSLAFEPAEDDREEGHLVAQVEDTGSGIEPELRPQIFHRFLTVGDHAGSGLGLYISNAFAVCMGGSIDCWSKVGTGTKMTLRVPVEVELGDAVAYPRETRAGIDAKRVLVVDDMDVNLESLSALLTACGFQASTAKDWRQAEAIIKQGVDTVLLDLRMPKVDGFELARRVQSMPDTVVMPRIIAVSGDATQATRAKVLGSGFDGFLAKPFTTEELLDALRLHAGSAPNPALQGQEQ